MKKNIITILLFCITTSISATIPSGYYHDIDSLCGEQLLLKLNEICSKGQFLDYGSGIGRTWYGFYYTDRDQDSTIIDMYSNEIRYLTDYNAVNDMHIEHSFPKSWWGGYENYAFKDLHHIFPADATTNIYKNNLPLGIVNNPIYNNGKSKIGTSTLYNGNCFEPDDEYKGDFARAYFYVATIYHNMYKQWNSPMLDNNSYPMWNDWAINLLLSWHKLDPVSDKEIKRQEAVYNIQHNRNPFIDIPELIDYIWGNKSNNPYRLDNDTCAYIYSPTIWDIVNMGTNHINTTITDTLSIKWNNLKEDIQLIFKNNSSEFSLSTNTITTRGQNQSNLIISATSTVPKFISDSLLIISPEIDTLSIPITINFIDCFIITDCEIITPRSFKASWIQNPNTTSYTIKLYNGYKSNTSNIFFCSYVEGSSYNKAIALFNGTGHAISLDSYSIKKQNNGLGSMKNKLQLSGTLENNSCYVICNSNASDSLLNIADLVLDYSSENNITNFNGNDALGLFYHDILIDVIGHIDDYTIWGENITLIRKPKILAPNKEFNIQEWNVYPQDYINIDNHIITTSSEQVIATISTTKNYYTFDNLLPQHTYTVLVQDSNKTTENAYSIKTPEIDLIEAYPASNIGYNSFKANWDKSLYYDKYQVNLINIIGEGITKIVVDFDSINSNGKPLPTNWTGTASGNYTTASSSGKSPNALALKNDMEYIQTPMHTIPINNFQFTYKYPSNATGSYFLVISIDSANTLNIIDSVSYSNSQKNTVTYEGSELINAHSIKIEYHKVKGNLSIDDIEYEYGTSDTILLDSVITSNNYISFYSLLDSTIYYYQVKGIINAHNETYVSTPSNIIEVTTLSRATTLNSTLKADDIIIYTTSNNISLENLPESCFIFVYDINGKLLHSKNNPKTKYSISLPKNQLYLIQVITHTNSKTFKILL